MVLTRREYYRYLQLSLAMPSFAYYIHVFELSELMYCYEIALLQSPNINFY